MRILESQNDRMDSGGFEVGVEAFGEFGPVVVGDGGVEVVFEVVEVFQGDDGEDFAAEEAGLGEAVWPAGLWGMYEVTRGMIQLPMIIRVA